MSFSSELWFNNKNTPDIHLKSRMAALFQRAVPSGDFSIALDKYFTYNSMPCELSLSTHETFNKSNT